jgi:pyruvate dehydrogenase E1 component beta subunit
MAKKRFTVALNEAFMEEMTRNSRIVLFGEDVDSSFFGDTRGLTARFGTARIRNTPISESALCSIAVGAAMAGMPVICHLMFSNFMYLGFDAIANQAAKMRLMTGGQARMPVTFVAAIGGGTSTGGHHSDTIYPLLMNLGGINVAVPTTPADAKGLMKTALRGDTPTAFLIARVRCGMQGEVPDEDYAVPFGKAFVHRSGTDVTIVAIGSAVSHALAAADTLKNSGIEAEVIDPRTLVPLDSAAILASVAKTGRLVVVDEARDSCSAASHIAAVVAEFGFGSLKTPIRRVTTPDVALPYAPALEKALLPSAARIVAAVSALVGAKPAEIA